MNDHWLGVLAGGVWNLASVWCLIHLLQAWLAVPPPVASAEGGSALMRRPSRQRQVVGWLLVKFPLLYLLVFVLLRHPAISVVGFGVGFSLVLVIMVGWLLRQAVQISPTRPYGR